MSEKKACLPQKKNDESLFPLNYEQRKHLFESRKKYLEAIRPETPKRDTHAATAWSLKDIGGGFFPAAKPTQLAQPETGPSEKNKNNGAEKSLPILDTQEAGSNCLECQRTFYESYLWNNFAYPVCTDCRKEDQVAQTNKYNLITKSTAMSEYLLTDQDIDGDRFLLLFVLKPNPRGYTNNMKLYLRIQIEEVSYFLYGGEQGLMDEYERREAKKADLHAKKRKRQLDKVQRALKADKLVKITMPHAHAFGEGVFVPEKNTWEKSCETCGLAVQYEKL